jgi:hypothetical protein
LIVGVLIALAVAVRWAARPLPPTGISGPPASARVPVPTAPSSAPPISAESLAKLKTLDEILRSKNDNDSRLDRDFNDLSSETKRLFRAKYHGIPAERRNERGTVVYLLGRNLREPEDWAFLREVAAEPACLSLSDCSKKPAPGGDEEAAGDEVTLAYTSLVALKQAQHALESSRAISTSGAAAKEAMGVIEVGRKSPVRAVSRMAEKLEKRFEPEVPGM